MELVKAFIRLVNNTLADIVLLLGRSQIFSYSLTLERLLLADSVENSLLRDFGSRKSMSDVKIRLTQRTKRS